MKRIDCLTLKVLIMSTQGDKIYYSSLFFGKIRRDILCGLSLIHVKYQSREEAIFGFINNKKYETAEVVL